MRKLKILLIFSLVMALIALLASCQPAVAPSVQKAAPPVQEPARVAEQPAAPVKEAEKSVERVKEQVITIYSGRAEGLVRPIIEQFSQATGIRAQVRYGGTAEMAATILEEGRNSPADLFFAQDPGGLGAVTHLLTPLPARLLDQVEAGFRSPEGKWVGLSGRARVAAYNTQKLKESDLPDDIWDFIDTRWNGRIGWAPTNASFQAMVTAMRVIWEEEKTRQWLMGIKANNPKSYASNTAIVAAIGTGEIDVGFPNHYYLFGFLQERGETFPVRNYHPRAGGPGALIMVAGAGILETSKNKQAAELFLGFMLSPVAQQYFAGKTYEYPVVKGITTHRLIKPIAEINYPKIDLISLADLKGTLSLLRNTGILP